MRHRAIVAHTAATAVFLILAGLALAPYQDGAVTPFYGFIAGPGLLLGTLAGAAWLDGWLISRVSRENGATTEDARKIAYVPGIALPYATREQGRSRCCARIDASPHATPKQRPRRSEVGAIPAS